MDYAEALGFLGGHIDHERSASVAAGQVEGLSLDAMRSLVDLLGDPQLTYPTIHVTGTNGKGSVSRMATALLAASGLDVGTYASPHLHQVNERICRNLEAIHDDELAGEITRLSTYEQLLEQRPTYFELLTAAAFDWFAEVAVDVAVVEVGLLGTYDATNVIEAQVAVVTSIGSDHTDFAAGWEHSIAHEKSGIIKPRSAVVLGEMDPDLHHVFAEAGGEELYILGRDFGCSLDIVALGGHQVTLDTPHGSHGEVFLPFHGAHQVTNAAVSVMAVEAFFDRRLDDEVVREGFGAVELPGRFEVLMRNPLLIVDAAHNPEGVRSAAETLRTEFAPAGSRIVVMGLLEGRDPRAMVDALMPAAADLLVVCRPPSARAMIPERVARAAEQAGIAVEVVADPTEATERALAVAAEEDVVLVLGSFYVVGPVRACYVSQSEDGGRGACG
ncbi:MAG: Dihydrofolate synthase/folylpolyglutamate synthase [Acidimicrobiales bacterium]|nr:MAG: bifunctional folylpolyglutamate synthase/dihydrofolate synthase [Actinomycetota bacterium]MBV6507625.1 Dihydrofolate synthase/folylpolyglutamate synthase [Acidimicrobiales bacterium]RIK07558.1 MAG: bifunctional folylpolyglutamate synthase/dihydrofolate synthase [Acidobacteriota bacterium]